MTLPNKLINERGRKMKKRFLAVLLVIVMLVTFASGCTQKTPEKPASTDTPAPGSNSLEENKSTEIDYPKKPITLMLGFSAGGSSDVMVRILANTMEKYIGKPVVVVNKPGAGGWVCWEELAKSVKPDGYTFSLINSPNISLGAYDTVNPRTLTIEDFDLLANQVTDYSVIAIRKDESRFTDLASLVEYAKNNTMLSACSATGIISDDATVTEYLNMYYDTDFQVIQTAGAKDSETMFLSGNSDILVANIGDILPQYKNGEYKIIAVFSPERVDLMPDVPTAKESGFGDILMYSARGYALPKGVDPAIREILLDALKKSINDPEVKDKLLELGAVTDFKEGQEYYDFLNSNIENSKKIYGIE